MPTNADIPSGRLADLVRELAEALRGRADVRFAVLFGSSVNRGPAQARDVDVAVSFVGSPSLLEVGALANTLEERIGKEVDLVDLESGSTLLRWQVLSGGVPIVVNDALAWQNFQVHVPIEYADLQPYLAEQSDGLRRVLEKARWSSSIS